MGRVILVLMLSMLVMTSCKRSPETKAGGSAPQSTNQKSFQVKGVVISIKPKEKSIEIKHEAIPDYMPAMTMPFDVKDTNELTGLHPGDSVLFRMLVTDTDGWIDQIRKITGQGSNSVPSSSPVRLLREVEPLKVGDLLPDYHFTNQFAQPISTSQFKGKALAITFIFTRCPFPTFCPLMANRFGEAQQKILAMPNAPANWQLLTISFDPDFDTPAVLKAYGETHQYNPAHSSFATGALTDITALAEQIGLTFWRDGTGSINHNLRTIVVGADGTLRKILLGNQWSSDELVEEIVKAAK